MRGILVVLREQVVKPVLWVLWQLSGHFEA
jgi:hypothetical protein